MPDITWRDNGDDEDPRARLIAEPALVIAGCPMHLEAWAVHYDEQRQMQVADTDDDDMTNLYHAVHADGSFETVDIDGRDYVLVATPHC